MCDDSWVVRAITVAPSRKSMGSGTLRIEPALPPKEDELPAQPAHPMSLWYVSDANPDHRLELNASQWTLTDACVVPLGRCPPGAPPADVCGAVLLLKESWVLSHTYDGNTQTLHRRWTHDTRQVTFARTLGVEHEDKWYDISLTVELREGRAMNELAAFFAPANYRPMYTYGHHAMTTLHHFGLSLSVVRPIHVDELGYTPRLFERGQKYEEPDWVRPKPATPSALVVNKPVVQDNVQSAADESAKGCSTEQLTPRRSPGRPDTPATASLYATAAAPPPADLCVDLDSSGDEEGEKAAAAKPPPREVKYEDGSAMTLSEDSELFCLEQNKWLNDTVVNAALKREWLAAKRMANMKSEDPLTIKQVHLLSTYEVDKIRREFDKDIVPRPDGPGRVAEMADVLTKKVFRGKNKVRDEHLKVFEQETEWTLMPVHYNNHWMLVVLHEVWRAVIPSIGDFPDAHAEFETDSRMKLEQLLCEEDDHAWLRADNRGYAHILFMDSLVACDKNKDSILLIHEHLDKMVRRYLTALLRVRNDLRAEEAHFFTPRLMMHRCLNKELPDQTNNYDCGLYVVAYARACMAHGRGALTTTRPSIKSPVKIAFNLSPRQKQQIVDMVTTGRQDLIEWFEQASGGRKLNIPVTRTKRSVAAVPAVSAPPAPAFAPSAPVAPAISPADDMFYLERFSSMSM